MRRIAAFIAAIIIVSSSSLVAGAAPPAPQRAEKKTPLTPVTAPVTDFANLKFRGIGPAVSGGRVGAVVGSDRNPMLYYVGGAGGGVFKSTNGTISFTPVFNQQPVGSIGAITIAPSNDDVVYVGTGEANPRNDVSFGDGLWRTSDAGKHWEHRGLAGSSNIARILVDPHDANVAVVAAIGSPWKDSEDRGVFRTTDGGKSWTKTLYLAPDTGAADLAWDPHHPETIYASMWQFRRQPWIFSSGGPQSGLYRSRDGGKTWTKLTQGLPTSIVGRIGIGVAPSDPRRVYAVVQSTEGVIWRSDDGGDHWTLTDRDTLPGQRPWYFSHLFVDPQKKDRVISLSMYLTLSKDGGKTFRHITGKLHPDNHTMWWSADGTRLIEGNDGGYILSNDRGATWSAPLNIPLAQTYHVGYDLGDPYRVCTGLQDNSSWCAPSNSTNTVGVLDRDWFSIAGGDGVWAIPDPSDRTLLWTDTQDGVLSIYDTKARQSIDISPWPRDAFTDTAGLANKKYRFNWNSPLAFAPSNPHVAYFGGNVVWRTEDRGRHWTPISPDLTRNDKEHQRESGGSIGLDVSGAEYYDTLLDVAPSPKDPGVIWTGSDDGLVQLTRDGGATWKNVTPAGLPEYGRIEAVEPGRFDAGTAFIVMDRHDLGDNAPHLYKTADYGASWTSIAGNLPADAPARTVREDLRVPNLLYAGTETGVWFSLDGGSAWTRLQLNLPTTPVYDIRIHPVANDMILATHGRGIFILDDLAPLQQLAAARAAGTMLFPIRNATLFGQWPPIETGGEGGTTDNNFVGPNPPAGALITFYQKTRAKTRPEIEIVAGDGHVIRHLRGSLPSDDGPKFAVSNIAGMNRLAWDGLEDGPVRWNGTSRQNAGPAAGAEALPGMYTARLTIDGTTYRQVFELKADPASPFTLTELQQRHRFLSEAFTAISRIDTDLNEIDRQKRALREKTDAASTARMAELEALKFRLTSDSRNDEDSIGHYDRVRERVFGVAGALGSSFQPPFAQHRDAWDELKPLVDSELENATTVLNRKT